MSTPAERLLYQRLRLLAFQRCPRTCGACPGLGLAASFNCDAGPAGSAPLTSGVTFLSRLEEYDWGNPFLRFVWPNERQFGDPDAKVYAPPGTRPPHADEFPADWAGGGRGAGGGGEGIDVHT